MIAMTAAAIGLASAPAGHAATFGATSQAGNSTCGGTIELVGSEGAPQAGTITELAYRSGTYEGGTSADLQALRPLGGGRYLVLGRLAVTDPDGPSRVVGNPADIAVLAGDVLGVYVNDDISKSFPCGRLDSSAGAVALPNSRPGVGDTITTLIAFSQTNVQATFIPALESFSPQKSAAPVYTSDATLVAGQPYDVKVRGTYSPYDPSLMASNTTKYFAMCGFPEGSPLFATPGIANSRVGSDPEFLFAFPQSGTKCSAKNRAALPKRQSSVRFDTGNGLGYVTPTATNAGAVPNGDHSYTYRVLGAGQPLKAKVPGGNYRDNYGRYQITVAAAASS